MYVIALENLVGSNFEWRQNRGCCRSYTLWAIIANLCNRRACTLIASKVCLLASITVKGQTLPEIGVHARLLDR